MSPKISNDTLSIRYFYLVLGIQQVPPSAEVAVSASFVAPAVAATHFPP